MARLDSTLAHLAPGVSACRDLGGRYNPRRGLAIYYLPIPGYVPSSPGMVLGEALAARSGLGCTLLEGVPAVIPEGAALVAQYGALKAARPDLLEDVPELHEQGQYAIKLGRSALVVSPSLEGLSSGMQTLSMLVLRHTEEFLPGCVIVDTPFCQTRALAIEFDPREIAIGLLLQVASFAATFKANRLQLILNDSFDPGRDIPGVESFVQTCQSFGIEIGVRMPLLGPLLSGEKTLIEAWATVRAAARLFGASHAALDDPCPADAPQDAAERIVRSVAAGEVGLRHVSIDADLILKSGFPVEELRPAGVGGWRRLWDSGEPPPPEMEDIPLAIDIQGPVCGFSSRPAGAFFHRLDAAADWLKIQPRRELCVSFRRVGISHVWQNLLYPAATGLIAAWGSPRLAEEAGWRFSNLLYGDLGQPVMDMWDAIARAFPPGLSDDEERFVRRVAFGLWPETEEEKALLAGIDWLGVTRNIKIAADALKNIASGLQRNAATLIGARLALYAMSWLHCLVALTPELERRRRLKYDADGRTEPIAAELHSNFLNWEEHLRELCAESGLELVETARIEAMGARLKALCENIFDYEEE